MESKWWLAALALGIWIFGASSADALSLKMKPDAFVFESEEYLDYKDVEKALEEMLPEGVRMSFSELVHQFIEGDFERLSDRIVSYVKEQFFYEMKSSRDLMIQMIGIIVISAVFTNFSMAFSKTFIAETGFYLTYLLLFTLILTSFRTSVQVTADVIGNMLRFMSALIPVFCLAVTLTGNMHMGVWYQQAIIGVITCIEWLISKGVLALIHAFVLISMINQLSKEDMLSKCADLIKTISTWIPKTAFGIVLGIQMIQGIILPAYDTIKSGWASRLASSVPGVGNVMGGVLKTVIGSAVLLKNGVGVSGMVILSVLFLVPMLKLIVILCMYMAAQAVVQPIADRRMVECLCCVSEGTLLLIKTQGILFVFFFLSLAMMSVASGAAFGG